MRSPMLLVFILIIFSCQTYSEKNNTKRYLSSYKNESSGEIITLNYNKDENRMDYYNNEVFYKSEYYSTLEKYLDSRKILGLSYIQKEKHFYDGTTYLLVKKYDNKNRVLSESSILADIEYFEWDKFGRAIQGRLILKEIEETVNIHIGYIDKERIIITNIELNESTSDYFEILPLTTMEYYDQDLNTISCEKKYFDGKITKEKYTLLKYNLIPTGH